ncbi:MAG: zinc ABC transporter substrate-binding protein [Lachnospiraceae bacterium]|nr:zinc ABC transporter substrate-binding protein [Lachnospiraceae bacterium]
MKKKLLALLGIMLVLILAGYGVTKLVRTETQEEETVEIVTTFYPMYIAALNIADGAEGVSITNLTDNQTGCVHDYQLTTKDMKSLSTADIVIMNGGELELFMEEAMKGYTDLDVITASEGITFLEGSTHDHDHHEEDHEDHDEESAEHTEANEEHDHIHSDINGHVWLNMNLYLTEIDNIANGLALYDPDNAKVYEANAASYKEKIKALKEELETEFAALSGEEVIAFHDAFAYLAQELGMEVVYTVEIESDTALSAGEIAEVVNEIKLHDIKYLFTEEQYSTSIASNIAAETGATVYVIDSLVTGPNDKDAYLNGMRENINTLKSMLLQEGGLEG